ncbi:hypothetical protein MHYP_G00194580, partial [Metynnis hypsauchen]
AVTGDATLCDRAVVSTEETVTASHELLDSEAPTEEPEPEGTEYVTVKKRKSFFCNVPLGSEKDSDSDSSDSRCQKSASSKRNPKRTMMPDLVVQIRTVCRVTVLLIREDPTVQLQQRRSRPCSPGCSATLGNEHHPSFSLSPPSSSSPLSIPPSG